MATPQYEEFYYSDFMPLPDTSTFKSYFSLGKYIELDYQDYDQYKKNSEPTQPSIVVKKDDIFPSFTLPDLEGVTWHSDSLKSGLLLLDFWYRACKPCLKAMPSLESLHQKYGPQGLLVLGINGSDSSSELKTFLNSRQIHYNSLLDESHIFAKRIRVSCYPTFFLIDAASKKVLFIKRGYSDQTEAELEALIKTQLGIK
jgi:peroxiredoxin